MQQFVRKMQRGPEKPYVSQALEMCPVFRFCIIQILGVVLYLNTFYIVYGQYCIGCFLIDDLNDGCFSWQRVWHLWISVIWLSQLAWTGKAEQGEHRLVAMFVRCKTKIRETKVWELFALLVQSCRCLLAPSYLFTLKR
jgi:hypothetical protein